MIAPPAIYLVPVKESVRKDVKVSAQNCYFKESGAFTGEIRLVGLLFLSEITLFEDFVSLSL